MIREPMKIISFDVGIKNMAYCVFELDNKNCKILDWNVVNLMNDSEVKLDVPKCKVLSKKTKKSCDHLAKYSKGEL